MSDYDEPTLDRTEYTADLPPVREPMPGYTPRHLDRVGRYAIRRVIGTGGMGSVYEAEQDQPRRLVALKLIRAGLSSDRARSRFEAESQILASLRHPGIAQVYEAGTHTEGDSEIPYFAMELIPGARPITSHADLHELGQTERLELFARACDAIEHAHERGVIHRDLKPSNILVDSEGNPKVIDFGVARATGEMGLPTMHTGEGQLVGTLQYMSPEQIEGDTSDLDARSDVYAMGIVLYELMTHDLPYDIGTVPVAQAISMIREQAPRPPCQVERTLSPDLDAIVLKALHKDRARRYASVGELAADLRRLLAGEPIVARRDSSLYVARVRATRTVGQHPIAARVVLVLAAWLIAAMVGVPLAYRWTPLARIAEHNIVSSVTPMIAPGELDPVRVITYSRETPFEELAAERGVEGVVQGQLVSWRLVHAELVRRLAVSGARVVAWDVHFMSERPTDTGFAAAIRELGEAGIPTVVASLTWQVNEDGQPYISSPIISECRWGAVSVGAFPGAEWWVDLLVQPEGGSPQMSFSLAAYAAYRQPGVAVHPELDPESGEVALRYLRVDADEPSGFAYLPEVDRLLVSAVGDAGSSDLGLRPDDLVARFNITIPPDDQLSSATRGYASVLRASEAELRAWFEGSVIVIGESTPGVDTFEYTDGRLVPGCYTHAAALASLLNESPIRMPRPLHVHGLTSLGALCGVLVVLPWATRRWRRVAAFSALVVAWIAMAVVAYWVWGYLLNPTVPLVAMSVAGGLGLILDQLRPGIR